MQFDFGHFQEGQHGFQVMQLLTDFQLRFFASKSGRVLQGSGKIFDAPFATCLALDVRVDPVQTSLETVFPALAIYDVGHVLSIEIRKQLLGVGWC